MSSGWHWFVIIGTFLSLGYLLWLLFANRHKTNKGTTGHTWDGIEELDNPLPMWWVGLFLISIVYMLIYLVYYPGLGNVTGAGEWSSSGQHDAEVAKHEARFAPLYAELGAMDESALSQDRRAMQVGRRLFLNHCSTCHGVNANGAFGFPDLTDDEWIWGGDYQAISTTITHGRMAQMPAWGPALGEDGVTNVANYVLKMAGREHDAAKAAAGTAQYNAICTACHGVDGKGNPALGSPNITNEHWLYGGNIDQLAFTIANGRQGNMPAQADVLSADKIHILSTYIRSLAK